LFWCPLLTTDPSEESPDGRLRFGLEEKPRSKVRASAKNDKLWQQGVSAAETGLITIWLVVIHGKGGQVQQKAVRLGISEGGERSPYLERLSQELLRTRPSQTHRFQDKGQIGSLINGTASELLHRELVYSGFLQEEASYSSRLLACIGVSR